VSGTNINEVAGIDTTAVDGTLITEVLGTFDGTLLHETTANDGDEPITITYVDLKVETQLNGTMTGVLIVDGMVTIVGI